ncbi:hypothetical protein [Nonomuraea sp. bgisy101]|uniref:hypothetical protein n=1 Tax=Nonomuraea sp. bgisy101 TaxID=3413784 RepID=UPI003D7526DD
MTGGEPIFWTWVRVVRRAELGFGAGKKRVGSDTVQHVAMVAVTYGNPDGTRIRPSVERLARVCRKDEKTVRLCLARLRDIGLLIRVFEGSSAGRAAKADEYKLAIPENLAFLVAMLDPDERTLIVPEGVQPPPPKRTRAPKTDSPATGTPGAAPADPPVDNPVDNPRTPGAAPADNELLASNHRVLPPGTPGAAPQNTGCSTRPPTKTYQPPTKDDSSVDLQPEEEGKSKPPAEPSAEKSSPPEYRQPPLLVAVPDTPTPNEYDAARDLLATLPDLGHELLDQARAQLGATTPRAQLVIHAANLARRRPA